MRVIPLRRSFKYLQVSVTTGSKTFLALMAALKCMAKKNRQLPYQHGKRFWSLEIEGVSDITAIIQECVALPANLVGPTYSASSAITAASGTSSYIFTGRKLYSMLFSYGTSRWPTYSALPPATPNPIYKNRGRLYIPGMAAGISLFILWTFY